MDEYFGSSENDVKVDSGSSDHIMNKINQLYSDSGIPVSSNKKDDILKPQMPKVLAEHEKKQKEFVPEVKQTGQNFWENLYTNQPFSQQNFQPSANIPKNTNFSASLKSKDVPANFESKYSTLNNLTLTSKKESFGKKEKESGKFKDLGIDYLLQTNIK